MGQATADSPCLIQWPETGNAQIAGVFAHLPRCPNCRGFNVRGKVRIAGVFQQYQPSFRPRPPPTRSPHPSGSRASPGAPGRSRKVARAPSSRGGGGGGRRAVPRCGRSARCRLPARCSALTVRCAGWPTRLMYDSERLRTRTRGNAGRLLPQPCRRRGCRTRQPDGLHMKGQNVLETLLAPQFEGVHMPESAGPG